MRRPLPAPLGLKPMDPKQDPQVREEALKTLYRLRAELYEREDRPTTMRKAVESLIERYKEPDNAPSSEESSLVSLRARHRVPPVAAAGDGVAVAECRERNTSTAARPRK